MQFGVEEDFLLVDPGTGQPLDAETTSFLEATARESDSDSTVFQTGDEALASLLQNRESVRAAALNAGGTAVGIGLAPALISTEGLGVPTSGQEGGVLRIHLPTPTPEEGIKVMNLLRRWLPILTGLGANSPVWGGRDTGFASWRTIANRTLPVHGIPPHFFGSRDYDERLERLLTTPGIETSQQVSWGARLSPLHRSLEVSAIDAQMTARESVLFALLIRSLAVEALHRSAAPDRITAEASDTASWHAARYGTQGDLVSLPTCERASASALAHQLFDAIKTRLEEFGDAEYVATGLRNLLDAGNGAARQRNAFNEGGIEKLIETAGNEFVIHEGY